MSSMIPSLCARRAPMKVLKTQQKMKTVTKLPSADGFRSTTAAVAQQAALTPPTNSSVESLTLSATCKCRRCVYKVTDVNLCLKTGEYRDDMPLKMMNCHCRNCRLHAGSAWAPWLTRFGESFQEKNITWVKQGKLKVVKTYCGGTLEFADMVCPEVIDINDVDGDEHADTKMAPVGFPHSLAGPSQKYPVVEKVLCNQCNSIMFMKMEHSDEYWPAAGTIDDGDFTDDSLGRGLNYDMWPVDRFPKVLRTPEFVELCQPERAAYKVWTPELKTDAQFTRRENLVLANKNVRSEVLGRCLCGKVRFECQVYPEEMHHCYCSWCRKYSGAAFQTWCPTENTNINWFCGSDMENRRRRPKALKIENSSRDGRRNVCRDCGTHMSMVYHEGDTETWLGGGSFCCESMELCEEGAAGYGKLLETEEHKENRKQLTRMLSTGSASFDLNSDEGERSSIREEFEKSRSRESDEALEKSSEETSAGGRLQRLTSLPSIPEAYEYVTKTASDLLWRSTSEGSTQAPQSGEFSDDSENSTSAAAQKLAARQDYVSARTANIYHICTASRSPWYKLPKWGQKFKFDDH